MRIEALAKYRGRPSISELPQPYRWQAEQNLSKMLAAARARGRGLDTWYVAILCGVAKREALNPHTSQWGRWMRAKKASSRAPQCLCPLAAKKHTEKARRKLKENRERRKAERGQAEQIALIAQKHQQGYEKLLTYFQEERSKDRSKSE